MSPFGTLAGPIAELNRKDGLGPDPVAALFAERRAAWSPSAPPLSAADCEALRPYVFGYGKLPRAPGEAVPHFHNFIDGEWRPATKGLYAALKSPADSRVTLFQVAASSAEDCWRAVAAADHAWQTLAWAEETLGYRRWVVQNFARLLDCFKDECLREIREQLAKTQIEALKDLWEARRCAVHLEGPAETAVRGEPEPPAMSGQPDWRQGYLPAGPALVLTPLSSIYGVPGRQLVAAYLSGCPLIFKGHPFAAATNTTLVKLWLAAGADPSAFQSVQGFGAGIATLATDPRIAVVSLTGSAETARKIQEGRGLQRLCFEGGGCHWAFVDDGYYDDAELERIAARLTHAKLAFGGQQCTSLHGVAATPAVLGKLLPKLAAAMDRWQTQDPRDAADDKVLSPLLAHKAQTYLDVLAGARKTGCQLVREGGRAEGEYGRQNEAVRPALVAGVTPRTLFRVDWDGRGEREVHLATDELLMPILVAMELPSFEEFLRFSLFVNPSQLATTVYTRNEAKLQRARRTLGGLLEENDGTDGALELGASTTLSSFCRRQKGRHLAF